MDWSKGVPNPYDLKPAPQAKGYDSALVRECDVAIERFRQIEGGLAGVTLLSESAIGLELDPRRRHTLRTYQTTRGETVQVGIDGSGDVLGIWAWHRASAPHLERMDILKRAGIDAINLALLSSRKGRLGDVLGLPAQVVRFLDYRVPRDAYWKWDLGRLVRLH